MMLLKHWTILHKELQEKVTRGEGVVEKGAPRNYGPFFLQGRQTRDWNNLPVKSV